MPAVLDVAIGTTFVFLLFSLVISALNEIWLSFLDKRAAFLKEGLRELLHDTSADGTAPRGSISVGDFLQHGLISSLSRLRYEPGSAGTRGVPSYIPGKSFVLTLLSLVEQQAANAASLKEQIGQIGDERLRQTLLSLYADAAGDVEHFKANVENWFNESMDRVAGWYKRYAQQWLFFLGLAIAIICNVDGLRIIGALSKNPELTNKLVKQATAEVEARRGDQSSGGGAVQDERGAAGAATTHVAPNTVRTAEATAAPNSAATADSINAGQSDLNGKIQKARAALLDLSATGIPIGWSGEPADRLFPPEGVSVDGFVLTGRWLGAIAGWLFTALAASLGAPFWFDLLNRFVDLRGVGRAPEEKDPTAPKKRATRFASFLTTGEAR